MSIILDTDEVINNLTNNCRK